MTVGLITAGIAAATVRGALQPVEEPGSDPSLAVGQIVQVSVGRQTAPGRYGVQIAGRTYSAETHSPLMPGTKVSTVVTRQSSRILLRVLGPDENPANAQLVALLAARFRIDLDAAVQREIVAAAASRPLATIRAALFLQKTGQPLDPMALVALVKLQTALSSEPGTAIDAPSMEAARASRASASALTPPAAVDAAALERRLERGLNLVLTAATATPAGGADQGSSRNGHGDVWHREQRTSRLLSLSGSGRIRYATLSLIVGGHLRELDVALFEEGRQTLSAPGERKLVVALATRYLGAVKIVARSIDDTLDVALSCDSNRGVAALSTLLPKARQALTALGWRVASLRCEACASVTSAAEHVIDQTLRRGALDCEL